MDSNEFARKYRIISYEMPIRLTARGRRFPERFERHLRYVRALGSADMHHILCKKRFNAQVMVQVGISSYLRFKSLHYKLGIKADSAQNMVQI